MTSASRSFLSVIAHEEYFPIFSISRNLEPRAFWYRSCAREGPSKMWLRDSTNSGYFCNLAS